MRDEGCPICGNPDASFGFGAGVRQDTCKCKVCGNYSISSIADGILRANSKNPFLWLLSRQTRRHWESHHGPLVVESDLVERILCGEESAPDPMEKADQFLIYLSNASNRFGQRLDVDGDCDYPVCSARNGEELLALARHLSDAGYLSDELGDNMSNCRFKPSLTMEGWDRVRELKATRARPDKAFIAMSFSDDPDLEDMFYNGFRPALKACGYDDADRLVLPEPDTKMCDAILAEVKRSGIVLADFTEQKPNVYYEAGFAQGLGTTVIKTCRKDDLGNCHFDTRQYPHIEWEPGKHEDFIKRVVDYVDLHGLRGPGATEPQAQDSDA